MAGRNKAHLHSKKKQRRTVREYNGAQFMLRCVQLGISWEMLNHIDIATVYDMGIEAANDREEYPIKATQADIEAFFGRG